MQFSADLRLNGFMVQKSGGCGNHSETMGETEAEVADRDGTFYVHCGIRVVNNIEKMVAIEVAVAACRNAITS